MTETVMPALLSCEELGELQFAARCLEGDSFASRAANLLGRQVEALGRALPAPARQAVARATESALKDRAAPRPAHDRQSVAGQGGQGRAQGGGGGFRRGRRRLRPRLRWRSNCRFRRRSCCARSPKSRARRARICRARKAALACIEVFALGGEAPGEAAIEGGYFAVRGALATIGQRERSVPRAARPGGRDARRFSSGSSRRSPRASASSSARSSRPRRFRFSAPSAARPSTSPSPSISRPSRAAISSCADWSASTGPTRCSSSTSACATRFDRPNAAPRRFAARPSGRSNGIPTVSRSRPCERAPALRHQTFSSSDRERDVPARRRTARILQARRRSG